MSLRARIELATMCMNSTRRGYGEEVSEETDICNSCFKPTYFENVDHITVKR